jgi:hypothetical protein
MNLKKMAVYFSMGLFLTCFVACSSDRNPSTGRVVEPPKVVEQPKVEPKIEEKKDVVLVSLINDTVMPASDKDLDDMIDYFKKVIPDSDKMLFIHEKSQSGKSIDIIMQFHIYPIDCPANCIQTDMVVTDAKTGNVLSTGTSIVQGGQGIDAQIKY